MAGQDDDGPSRRQLARAQTRKAGDRSARVAHTLMAVHASVLGKLDLDDDLRRVLDRARAVTSHIARRREERTLAGALRRIDLAALEGRLARVQATGVADQRQVRLAETWRARLLDDGPTALTEFYAAVPDARSIPLPQLIADALRERASGRPPGAGRALFRQLFALMKAPPDDGDGDGDGEDEADAGGEADAGDDDA